MLGTTGISIEDIGNEVADGNALLPAKPLPVWYRPGELEARLSVNPREDAPKMIAGIEVCRVVRYTALEPFRRVVFRPRWVKGSNDQGSRDKIKSLQKQVLVKLMKTGHDGNL